MSSWLEYCAEGLQQTLERVWQRIQQLSASRGRAQVVLRPKQGQLLQLLRARGGLSPREIWDGLRISKQGAMDLIRPLVKAKTRQAGGHAEERALRAPMIDRGMRPHRQGQDEDFQGLRGTGDPAYR